MPRILRKTPRVIIRHQVHEVHIWREALHVEVLEMVRAGGDREREEEMGVAREIAGVGVEFLAEQATRIDEVGGLARGVGILPINIQPIESQVLQQLHSRLRKHLASRGALQGWREVRADVPAADREEGFHVTVGFLLEV